MILKDIHSQCLPIRVWYGGGSGPCSLLRTLFRFCTYHDSKSRRWFKTWQHVSVVALLQSIACPVFRTRSNNADFSLSPVKAPFWFSFSITPNNLFVCPIYALIVLCVGKSKAPPVLYPSYSTDYVEAHAIQHGT